MTDTPPKTPQTGTTSGTTPSGSTTPSSTSTPTGASSTSTTPTPATGSSTTGSGSDRLKHTAEEARDNLSRSAREGGEHLRDTARETAENARRRAVASGENAKDNAADEIGRTADALETAAGEVDDGSVQQQLLREAADGLTRISGAMKGKDLGDIVGDISQFGREHPAAFLGGAALAGFALARFARASETSRAAAGTGGVSRDPYATTPYRPATDYRPATEAPGTTTYPASDFGGVKP